MQTDNKFNCTEAGSKMSRIDRTALDHIMTDFLTKRPQLSDAQCFDIFRRVHLIKKCICRIILIHIAFKND